MINYQTVLQRAGNGVASLKKLLISKAVTAQRLGSKTLTLANQSLETRYVRSGSAYVNCSVFPQYPENGDRQVPNLKQ